MWLWVLMASLRWQGAGGRRPMGIPLGRGARLQGGPLRGSASDPTVLLFLPPQGFWKRRAAREVAVVGVPPLPAGAGGRPGTLSRSRCARLQLAPAPGPFFSPLFVRALLIWEQGPFMWRRAWPGLASPPRAGDFLFIWHREPRAPSETAGGTWWCHRTWVTQLSWGFVAGLLGYFKWEPQQRGAGGRGKGTRPAGLSPARPSQARPLKGGPSPKRTIPFQCEDWPVTPAS